MTIASHQGLVRIIAPITEPLTLAEAKLYLRIDGSAEDSLIADLIAVARELAEQYMRISLITQQWKISFDDYVPEELLLPYPPIVSIESIMIFARDGSSVVVEPDSYFIGSSQDTLVFDTIIYGHRIEIIYNTGYGNAADIPSPIKYGMLAHMAFLYEQRGEAEIATLPRQSMALYSPFRRVSL